MSRLILKYSLWCIIAAAPLHAHDDPHDVIHALTHQIETAKGEDREKLYMKRAIEHRSVGHIKSAQSDFLKVTQLNSEQFYAWLALGKLQQGKQSALLYFENAMEVAKTDEQKALVNIGYAEFHYQLGFEQNDILALIYADKALKNRGNSYADTELVLFKAHALFCLGQMEQRARFLTEAMQENRSVVIRNKQIDALIALGTEQSLDQITPLIQHGIENSRFTSTWKIRLAQCQLKKGQNANANALLSEAIAEINKRFNPDKPDSTLLMDRAVAKALLNDVEAANLDLQAARKLSHDHFLLREIQAFVNCLKAEESVE